MKKTPRLAALRKILQRESLDALLVTEPANVRYLCGFHGSSGLLLAGASPVFFTDPRYDEQAHALVEGARVVVAGKSLLEQAASTAKRGRVRRLGVEAARMTLSEWRRLAELLDGQAEIVLTEGLVEGLRAVKDAAEIQRIERAVRLGSALLPGLLETLRPGAREIECAAQLEHEARRRGAEAMSFETIIAGGARSSMPHGAASRARLPRRGFVVCDYGVLLEGYCSDMTRTPHIGRATDEERRVYEAVLEAHMAGAAAVRPGVECRAVDEAARAVLRRAGLGERFTHSLGHGVGLHIHEAPRLAANQQTRLAPGMIVTIEPGVYLNGRFGVRIEDMLVVTEKGSRRLTRSPRELVEL